MDNRPRPQRRLVKSAAAWVLAASFCGSPAAGLAEDGPAPAKKLGPLEKSLLVPGWGQLAEKHYLEGIVFLGAEVACLFGALRNDKRGNESYALYKAAGSAEDAVGHRRDVETYDGRRNCFLLAAAAVWAVNLVDILLIVKRPGAGPKSVALKVGSDAFPKIRLSLACRF